MSDIFLETLYREGDRSSRKKGDVFVHLYRWKSYECEDVILEYIVVGDPDIHEKILLSEYYSDAKLIRMAIAKYDELEERYGRK